MRNFLVAAILLGVVQPAWSQQTSKPFVPIGLFFGSIEEGARIFTPVRLVPISHPDAVGHQFPTALRLHGTEFPVLLWLGERAGYKLWPTLQRYPAEPDSVWPYPEFAPPPDTTSLANVREIRRPAKLAPLPGLRAVLFMDQKAVAFIVDTRSISMKECGLSRSVAMGLDITRAQFLDALAAAGRLAAPEGPSAVIYSR